MVVFKVRRELVQDYCDYTRSFVSIADEWIREHVDAELRDGLLRPEPLFEPNPKTEVATGVVGRVP